MKKSILTVTLVLSLVLIIFPIEGKTQGPGMMGRGGQNWNYCPYCGSSMGPGMMGPGYGMGAGMMGPGYGTGPGMMGPGYGPQYQQPREPMKEKDAKAIVENYLQSKRNPNLKLGKITAKDKYFEAEIHTKDGSLVDKIVIDKYTGWMRSIYQ